MADDVRYLAIIDFQTTKQFIADLEQSAKESGEPIEVDRKGRVHFQVGDSRADARFLVTDSLDSCFAHSNKTGGFKVRIFEIGPATWKSLLGGAEKIEVRKVVEGAELWGGNGANVQQLRDLVHKMPWGAVAAAGAQGSLVAVLEPWRARCRIRPNG